MYLTSANKERIENIIAQYKKDTGNDLLKDIVGLYNIKNKILFYFQLSFP